MLALAARKPKVLGPVHANLGLKVEFRSRLEAMIAEMQAAIEHFVIGAYEMEPPAMGADASAATTLRAVMRNLNRRWQKRFDQAAPELAEYFSRAQIDRTDKQLQDILRKAGFSVEFKMTPAMHDAYEAAIGEQVSLIKSIASEHLSEVEGLVMRAVQAGRDVGALRAQLQMRYGVTRRRAALISTDQLNKANSVTTRARQMELGLNTAIWQHSHGGKHPRPSHVAFSGKLYDVREGALIEGERIWPGQLINCRCVSRPVIPGLT